MSLTMLNLSTFFIVFLVFLAVAVVGSVVGVAVGGKKTYNSIRYRGQKKLKKLELSKELEKENASVLVEETEAKKQAKQTTKEEREKAIKSKINIVPVTENSAETTAKTTSEKTEEKSAEKSAENKVINEREEDSVVIEGGLTKEIMETLLGESENNDNSESEDKTPKDEENSKLNEREMKLAELINENYGTENEDTILNEDGRYSLNL